MIPILRERSVSGSTISFPIVAFLTDTINPEVTEERNGIFEFRFEYPVNSTAFKYLQIDMYVEAKANDTEEHLQYFRIYDISKEINGTVTIDCEHVSYELSKYPVYGLSSSGSTAGTALSQLLMNAKNFSDTTGQNCSNLNKYLVFAEKSPSNPSSRTEVKPFDIRIGSMRSSLGGSDGSLLQIFGGEFRFDNFNIHFYENRGSDTGIIIKHKKNLTDVKISSNMDSSYTHIFPYAVKKVKDETTGEETEEIILLDTSSFPKHLYPLTNYLNIAQRTLIIDLTSAFEQDETIDSSSLATKTLEYSTNHPDLNKLSINMTVSFVNLWQSPEYKEYAPLEKVGLCDKVRVIHEGLYIDQKLKVIKTVYNPMSERYESIELGTARSDFSSTIKSQNQSIENLKKIIDKIDIEVDYDAISAEIDLKVSDASDKIKGVNGGYVVMNSDSNGKPYEILIMDNIDKRYAVNVIRLNKNGIGFSNNGYNGTYRNAWTIDGQLNASFITTGELTANIIKAGILSKSSGTTYFDLNNDKIVTGTSSGYKTEIQTGQITSYFNNLEMGGLLPTGNSTELCETLYFNQRSSNGIAFAVKNSDGTFTYRGIVDSQGYEVRYPDSEVYFDTVIPYMRGEINKSFSRETEKETVENITTSKNVNNVNIYYSGNFQSLEFRANSSSSYQTTRSIIIIERTAEYTKFKTNFQLNVGDILKFNNESSFTTTVKLSQAGVGKEIELPAYLTSVDHCPSGSSTYSRIAAYIFLQSNVVRFNSTGWTVYSGSSFKVTSIVTETSAWKTKTIFGNYISQNGQHWSGVRQQVLGSDGIYSTRATAEICGIGGFSVLRFDNVDAQAKYVFIDEDGYYFKSRYDLTDNNYADIYCGKVNGTTVGVSSSERIKKNISKAKIDILSKLENSVVYNYDYRKDEDATIRTFGVDSSDENVLFNPTYHENETDEAGRYGFVIEKETPSEVICKDGKSIDLYSLSALNWKASQSLYEKIKTMETAIETLIDCVARLEGEGESHI